MTVERIHLKAPVMLIFIAIFTCLPCCINFSNIEFNFNFWELYYSKFDFLICLSDRSQCLEFHVMVDFAYKLQLHYNIYTLIFPIWTENIIKVKIPLGSYKLYAKRNIP